MKCHFVMSVVVLLVLLLGASVRAQRLSVAVVDFEGRGVESHEAAIIAERFRGELVRLGALKVMERGQMEAVLKEQGFQQSGACNDASCMIEMGQLLSVGKMIAGLVGKIGSIYTVDVKVLDVTTGEIVHSHSENVQGSIEDVLLKTVPVFAEKFSGLLAGTTSTVGKLDVVTKPEGASVKVGGKDAGTSPVRGLEVPVGEVRVSVSLKDYATQEQTVKIVPDKNHRLDFSLSHTAEYLEGRKEEAQAQKRKTGRVLRIASGVVALAGLGGAALVHMDAERKFEAYDSGTDPGALPGQWDSYRTSSKNRLITLAVGVVGAIGVGVSFAF